MRGCRSACPAVLFILVGLGPAAASAQPTPIADVLASPARYVNRTITVVGQVQATSANPAGTTRGAYALVDDSSTSPIMVSTRDLPPVGKTFTVVGVVTQDPAWPAAFLREVSRSAAPGGAGTVGPISPAPSGPAVSALVADILASPPRYWNRTVRLTGDVQGTVANPPGTTRGTYTLLDESTSTPMTVRSTDLPPVGRTFAVIGVVTPDPTTGRPLLKETSRTATKR